MSFDIPQHIESKVQEYAGAQHISTDEAILRLIQSGLDIAKLTPAQAGLGLFSSTEDSDVLDAAVKLAYEDRRRPSKRIAG